MTMQKKIFTPEELAVINDIFGVQLNFETPVVSAIFKLKMDSYSDEKWDRAMAILHPVLPLDESIINGESIYKPFYQDEENLSKSASIYVALKEYQADLKRPKAPSDLYFYGSLSNKEAHMEQLNKFFNTVRFSTEATGPFWYALEVAIPETETRGYELLSQYISPRRMQIDKPMWVEADNTENYRMGSIVCYDFGSDKDYTFFKKIAADLEYYQKRKAEHENPLLKWEPKRILAYGAKMEKQHTR
ncbi:MAG: hypothetical protein IKV03_05790 [Alphaproteobacteria bacterium]|nr:hypothetical protein [Alphaproteobacteria bacterium]